MLTRRPEARLIGGHGQLAAAGDGVFEAETTRGWDKSRGSGMSLLKDHGALTLLLPCLPRLHSENDQ